MSHFWFSANQQKDMCCLMRTKLMLFTAALHRVPLQLDDSNKKTNTDTQTHTHTHEHPAARPWALQHHRTKVGPAASGCETILCFSNLGVEASVRSNDISGLSCEILRRCGTSILIWSLQTGREERALTESHRKRYQGTSRPKRQSRGKQESSVVLGPVGREQM